MSIKCIKYMGVLKSYGDKLAEKGESETAGVAEPTHSRAIKIIEVLEGAGRVSKRIRKQYGLETSPKNASTSTGMVETEKSTNDNPAAKIPSKQSVPKVPVKPSVPKVPVKPSVPKIPDDSSKEPDTGKQYGLETSPKNASTSTGMVETEKSTNDNPAAKIPSKQSVPKVPVKPSVPKVPVKQTMSKILDDSSKEPDTFRVLMIVVNFLPAEVEVGVHEKYLVIHGQHGNLFDDHGTISREFTRKFDIPEGADIESLRFLVDDYGVLTVEAPVKRMKNKDLETLVTVPLDSLPDSYKSGETFADFRKRFEEKRIK